MSKNYYKIETFKYLLLINLKKCHINFGEKMVLWMIVILCTFNIFQKWSMCLIIDRQFAGACLCENLGKKRCLICLLMIDEKFQSKGFGK